ncbi:hypothetical protein [Halobaculum limi]|uniref:hypothetical protein n=1 Tax=Halobaculum limi TaxID=3031916 RepID=UPI002404F29D|nr:hypothetical protein [Halobaculum sp. YSMS11]
MTASNSWRRDVALVFVALVLGFVAFLALNYLALFGVVSVDSDLFVVWIGVAIGYAVARLSGRTFD